MLIQSLAQKTRLAMLTVLATLCGSVALCGFTLWRCLALVGKERQQIYILDGDIPFLAERAQLEANFAMEAKAHIQLFHHFINIRNAYEQKGTKRNIIALNINMLQTH